MPKSRQGLYMISVVADMFDLHPQTLRTYEREGLIRPARTEGNTRLYSEEDVRRIELILRLTQDLGVNLAGVAVILQLRDQMEALRNQMADMVRAMADRLDPNRRRQGAGTEGLVPVGLQGLVRRWEAEMRNATFAMFDALRAGADRTATRPPEPRADSPAPAKRRRGRPRKIRIEPPEP
jgi:MerR family transcriptional regulator/heat shock protein HspR